jgi:hypothetical protein
MLEAKIVTKILCQPRPTVFYLYFSGFFPREDWKIKSIKGPVIIYVGGWHQREMFFVEKILLTQPLKSQKFDYPTSSIN